MLKKSLSSLITVACCVLFSAVTVLAFAGSISIHPDAHSDVFPESTVILKGHERLELAYKLSLEGVEIEQVTPPSYVSESFYAVKAARDMVKAMLISSIEKPFASASPIPTPSAFPREAISSSSVASEVEEPFFSNISCPLYRLSSVGKGKGQVHLYHVTFDVSYGDIGGNFSILLDAHSLLPYSISTKGLSSYHSENTKDSCIKLICSYWGGDPIYDEESSFKVQSYYSVNGYIPHIELTDIWGKKNFESYCFDNDVKYYAISASNKAGGFTTLIMTQDILKAHIDPQP
ncbi:MAG: hypothetical protein IKK58_03220 [Clostridia bacterium]|nr:hypothetical protein [Clostridia bacterium]